MNSYYESKTKGLVIVADKPPVVDVRRYSTTICIVPATCHGCGNCKLCGPGCTCSYQASCGLANRCNSSGHCLNPANCTDNRPPEK
jgi:hypothetical protein